MDPGQVELNSSLQLGLIVYIPPSPPATYLSFILREMGFSTFDANLLTIPSQFLFGVNVSPNVPIPSLPDFFY